MRQRNLHRLAALLLALPTVCLGAGWSGVWPAQEHPRETKRQLAECYTAIVERVTATHTDWDTIPSQAWYRSNRGNLLNIKVMLRWTLEPRASDPMGLGHSGLWLTWVVTNGVGNTTTAANTLTATQTNVFPHYGGLGAVSGGGLGGSTSLLSALKMPTNYLDYTPFRCLAGLGPFTNDTSVPYPHGWSNTTTLAGGTNFPAGRTCWYTTDYGWADLPRVFAELTITLEQGVLTLCLTNGNYYGQKQGTNHQPWTSVKSLAESDYKDRPDSGISNFFPVGIFTYGLGYADDSYWNHKARAEAGLWYHGAWNAASYTGAANVAEYYVYSDCTQPPGGLPSPVVETNSTFADAGTGLSQTNYAFVVDDTSPYSNGVSGVWGDLTLPTWCNEPSPPADPLGVYGYESVGFKINLGNRNPAGLRRWTFTFY